MEDIKIHCPKCKWEPPEHAQWSCTCGFLWNTFDTGGQCPKCKKTWKDTQCLPGFLGGCGKWSPHADWYHISKGITGQISKEELVKVRK